jgi:hypothetical protein
MQKFKKLFFTGHIKRKKEEIEDKYVIRESLEYSTGIS